MVAEIKALRTDAVVHDESVIERLEEALASARAGVVQSVGIAIVYRNGDLGVSWSACRHVSTLLGAAYRLCIKINERIDENN